MTLQPLALACQHKPSSTMEKNVSINCIFSSYNEETAHPVLLNFHGFGGNAKDYFTFESDFQEVADQEGVILVYPQALLLSGFSVWNAAPFAEDNKNRF